MLQNPILRGFNPDPSIIRVGDDYYIATSTFEWFPGVQIHHSKDLINWELVAHPLNRLSQLDMKGNPDSGGVWAPCLSYDNGTFYLVYSNVRSFQGVWKDTPNYLVTTDDILGEWSDPIFLNASGFDGSLFHEDNGRKWYLSMLVDHRKGKFFGGIILQEYDPIQKRLTGEMHHIYEGTELGLTEGPHIYQKDGWYYLITAEGGTEYGHAVSFARSRTITGHYEDHPENPILSSRWNPDAPLQKTGHADIVQTPNGDWYIVFLTGRPLHQLGRCTLGRETAIEELEWKTDDWPRLKAGGRVARQEIPFSIEKQSQGSTFRDVFEDNQLNIHFQSLRIPMSNDWVSLQDRKGHLRLYGQESLSSLHCQSMIARRVQAFHIQASTTIDFQPTNFQQMAGLVCYYNTYHWHYCYIMGDEKGGCYLQITTCDKYEMTDILEQPIRLSEDGYIHLKVDFHHADIQFFYRETEGAWQKVGGILDGSILSDDYIQDAEVRYRPAFTGSFVGICCQDLTGMRQHADFDYFEYSEI